MTNKPATVKTLKTGKLTRLADIVAIRASGEGEIEERTIELSFSSEAPVERWFGTEILGHKRGEVELDWFKSGRAPLLVDHNTRDQIGVIEKASVGSDHVGRATVRLGKSARATEIWQDVQDKIRSAVSVGYRINELELVKAQGADAETKTYRATKWTPMEVSIVAVPADASVGVGRGEDADFETLIRENTDMTEDEKKAADEAAVKKAAEVRSAPVLEDPNAGVKAERDRVREITAIGRMHNMADFAEEHIGLGTSLDAFRGLVLAKVPREEAVRANPNHLGLTKRELKQFSLLRMIQLQLAAKGNAGNLKAFRDAAGFELEMSQEVAQRLGKDPQGFFVPLDVRMVMAATTVIDQMNQSAVRGMHGYYAQLPRDLVRDLTAGGSTSGAELVGTSHMAGLFIDLLYNATVLRGLGATVLSGLVGNVSIPKASAGASGSWVAENAAPSETTHTTASLALSPKTLAAYTEISRRLLIQSSPSVEDFVRRDLVAAIGVALDTAGIKGSGTNNQPTGILNTSGIGAVADSATNGGVITWAKVVDNEKEVSIDNALFGRLAYLTNPKVVAKMKQTGKQSSGVEGNFILNPDMGDRLNGYGYGVTNSVPSDLTKGVGTALSALIFGNFADLIIAEWGVLDVLVDPFADSTKGLVRVSTFLDADIGVRRAQSFSATQDINTA